MEKYHKMDKKCRKRPGGEKDPAQIKLRHLLQSRCLESFYTANSSVHFTVMIPFSSMSRGRKL